MANVNVVILAGNLTRDPELKYLPSGTAVAEFGLAINRDYEVQGERREETTFVDIVTWGRQAETCSQYLAKGAPALIEGSLQLDQWKNKDGENRSRLRVRAQRVQFLSRPRSAGGGGEYGDAPGPRGGGPEAASRPEPGGGAPPPPEPDDENLPF